VSSIHCSLSPFGLVSLALTLPCTACSYMFDVLYVTWFVHVATALVSAKFWYLYWIVSRLSPYRTYSSEFSKRFLLRAC
jgi:hypothetical protein